MTNTTAAIELLTNGSMFGAVQTVYNGAMGGWWIIILHVLFITVVSFTTKSTASTAVYSMVTSAGLISLGLLPIYGQYICYTIIVFSFAGVLYEVFGGRE